MHSSQTFPRTILFDGTRQLDARFDYRTGRPYVAHLSTIGMTIVKGR